MFEYNTIQYNKLYLKSENIKHYNTSSNELLNPTYEYAYINNKTKSCTQYLQKKNVLIAEADLEGACGACGP